ncbi:MAG: YdcF family protein [Clostridia bacterium]|nr:YdcF family protein [Clostridia bacterium]
MIKRLMGLLLGLAAVAVLAALGLMGFVCYKEKTLPEQRPSDVIIVLGAQVKADGTPSVALERRMTAALEVYRDSPQTIICCGARGANEPEAEGTIMHRWMIAHGVREEDVIAETASFNTRQNLLNAKALMAMHGFREALVVTSDYHVARALALCREVGISATGKGSPSKPEYFVKNHIREGLSWIKYMLERHR